MDSNLMPKKGNAAVYIVLLVVIIALMAVLHKCSTKGGASYSDASGGDTLRVAIEYSPLSCYTYSDTLGGFCYDAVKLVAACGHRYVKFYPLVQLEEAIKGLNEERYDVLIAQFPVTKESREDFLFTDELYLDRQVLVQRADSTGVMKVKSQLDLAGCTLHVVKGSPMRSRIESLSREIGDSISVEEDADYGPEQLFVRVAIGEIDYAVINESTAKQLAVRYPDVNIDTGISFTQFQSMIIRKDNQELCDSVNSWLRTAKKLQAFASLRARYHLD